MSLHWMTLSVCICELMYLEVLVCSRVWLSVLIPRMERRVCAKLCCSVTTDITLGWLNIRLFVDCGTVQTASNNTRPYSYATFRVCCVLYWLHTASLFNMCFLRSLGGLRASYFGTVDLWLMTWDITRCQRENSHVATLPEGGWCNMAEASSSLIFMDSSSMLSNCRHTLEI